MIDPRSVRAWEAESAALRDEIMRRNSRIAELEAALRPFADAYRRAKAKGAPHMEAIREAGVRVGHFHRAAELAKD